MLLAPRLKQKKNLDSLSAFILSQNVNQRTNGGAKLAPQKVKVEKHTIKDTIKYVLLLVAINSKLIPPNLQAEALIYCSYVYFFLTRWPHCTAALQLYSMSNWE